MSSNISQSKDTEFKQQLSEALYWIRGVAIILVVIGHVIGFDRAYGMRKYYDSDLSWLGLFGDGINTIHMPIFFIASGLATAFFSRGVGSYKSFFTQKLPRLVLPLIIWAPPFFIFQSLAKNRPIDFTGLVLSIFEPYEIFWFLHALIFAAMFHFLFSKLTSSKSIYFGTSVVLTGLSFFPPFSSFETYLYWNIFFAVGIVMATELPVADRWLNRQPLWLWFSLILLCVSVVTTTKLQLPLLSQLLMVRLVTGIPGFVLLYLMCGLSRRLANRIARPSVHSSLVHIGTMSMVIYLFHGYFTRFSVLILTKLSPGMIPIGYFLILSITGIGAPLLLNVFILRRSSPLSYITGSK